MKRIILLELCLLFLATTFQGDNPPPGWYIQQIPVNKNIVDIYFTDTLHGWAVTTWTTSNDTAYILKTTNGGANWLINNAPNIGYQSIQFLDSVTGYTCGGTGTGKLYKTTNSGNTWNLILSTSLVFRDLYFINKDTGWICDDNLTFGVGLLKTTNGGINWSQQLNDSYQPKKLFFLNKDTGWVMTADNKLYRTINSGVNWNMFYSFGSSYQNHNFFFTSIDTGWVSQSSSTLNDLLKTTNGGNNWQSQLYPYYTSEHPGKLYMLNSSFGYLGFPIDKILKTTDGISWGYQNTPIGYNYTLFFTDSLHGWASHGYNATRSIVSTRDGGGPLLSVRQISTEVPIDYVLSQNYPNPFNATANIKYKVSHGGSSTSDIKITVFDIMGRDVQTLVNEKHTPGTYQVNFDGNSLSSGIYFYSLSVDGKMIETKRMMLLK